MDEVEAGEKLKRLQESADIEERHSLALELSNTRDRHIFETVLNLMRKPGLEPIMKVEVVTPDDHLGDVISDLNNRRGLIQSTDARGDDQVVVAIVPLANIFGHVDGLRSLSQGGAQCT